MATELFIDLVKKGIRDSGGNMGKDEGRWVPLLSMGLILFKPPEALHGEKDGEGEGKVLRLSMAFEDSCPMHGIAYEKTNRKSF